MTGASGFVGRCLTSALLREADSWKLQLVSRMPLDLATRAGTAQHIVRDIAEPVNWAPLLEGIDVVVHAAARAHILNDSGADAAAKYQRVNTEGTLRLAREAAAAGVKRFVFLSTIGVHGGGRESPYKETDPLAPHTPYAQSKMDAEQGLQELSLRHAMEVVIVRPPLVYGRFAPGNFSRLAAAVRRGLPLPLARVQNLRSLVAVDNLVDFIQCCMVHPAAAGQAFLVSDDCDISTPELIRRMGIAMYRPARLFPVPLDLLRWGAACAGRQAMLHQLTSSLQADISKARTLLGWSPPISLDTGLARAFSPSQTA